MIKPLVISVALLIALAGDVFGQSVENRPVFRHVVENMSKTSTDIRVKMELGTGKLGSAVIPHRNWLERRYDWIVAKKRKHKKIWKAAVVTTHIGIGGLQAVSAIMGMRR